MVIHVSMDNSVIQEEIRKHLSRCDDLPDNSVTTLLPVLPVSSSCCWVVGNHSVLMLFRIFCLLVLLYVIFTSVMSLFICFVIMFIYICIYVTILFLFVCPFKSTSFNYAHHVKIGYSSASPG